MSKPQPITPTDFSKYFILFFLIGFFLSLIMRILYSLGVSIIDIHYWDILLAVTITSGPSYLFGGTMRKK